MIAAMACRSAAPLPSEPADLAGRVVDVQDAAALPGITLQQPGVTPAQAGGILQVMRVRVATARGALPGSDATIGIDAATQVAFSDSAARPSDRGDLTGTFARVWIRGIPRDPSPSRYTAMARLVVVDSLARHQ